LQHFLVSRFEWLATDGSPIAAADLGGLGIYRFTRALVGGVVEAVPSVQVEMYCETMALWPLLTG
jgi:hypothetical protein